MRVCCKFTAAAAGGWWRSAAPLENCSTINISYTPLPSPRKNGILRKANEQGSKTQGEGRAVPLLDPLPPSPGKAVYVGSENGLGIGEGDPWLIGGGEWFPPHPPRGDGPASKVSFIVTTAGHAPTRSALRHHARCAAAAGGYLSKVSARGVGTLYGKVR